jgi:hypothetical protein
MLTGYRSLTIPFVEFDVTSATAFGGIAGCPAAERDHKPSKKLSLSDVRLWPKADMGLCAANVRY